MLKQIKYLQNCAHLQISEGFALELLNSSGIHSVKLVFKYHKSNQIYDENFLHYSAYFATT